MTSYSYETTELGPFLDCEVQPDTLRRQCDMGRPLPRNTTAG